MEIDNLNGGDSLPPTYTLDDALSVLNGENSSQLSAAVSYGLSDLSASDSVKFQKLWITFGSDIRQTVIEHLIDVSEANIEFDYRAVGYVGLFDDDEIVRERSIELLWEDKSTRLLEHLLQLAQWDESSRVRAAAVQALGRFILEGEYGKLSKMLVTQTQDLVFQLWNNEDEDVEVRRRALEAISNSSHEAVPEAILEAYNSHIQRFIVSSVYAMGRSCDSRWEKTVLKELSSENPEMRYEAARASGELELESAIQPLGRLALSEDRDIQETAIWSLGEIGGSGAIKVLNQLAERLDNDEWDELVEDAIANANLGADLPDLLGFQDLEDDEY